MLARKGAQVPRDLTDGATVRGKGPEGRGQPAREGPALSGADPGPRRVNAAGEQETVFIWLGPESMPPPLGGLPFLFSTSPFLVLTTLSVMTRCSALLLRP